MQILLLSAVLLATAFQAQQPQASMVPNGIDGAAIFAGGQTYDAFLSAADVRPEVWQGNTKRSHPPGDLVDRLKAANVSHGGDLRLVVVAVAACSDSVHTVPYIATLAEAAGIPLRVVTPDAGKPIQDTYRTPDGRGATATAAVLDGDRVVGAWVERPVALQTWMLGPASALPQSERLERKFGWYEWDRGESTMRELVELIEGLR